MLQKSMVLGGNAELELMLADECAQFYSDPYGWAMWAFDWDHGELAGFTGLDDWQRDYLIDIGNEVKARGFNGVSPVDPIRNATASGHGIGKSAVTAIVILWIMSTRPHAKGIVTANTGEQLRTKTWAELGKWRTRCIVGHWFEYNNGKGSMSLYHKAWPESWRVDAQTCREENSEAFAGLHAANSTPFYVFDEASAVPDKIWEVAEGGLTDGEPMFFVFGNPTRNSGEFRECFRAKSKIWNTRQIDSRSAKMTNKRLINQWIDLYGEDSDFVRVRVRGTFPRGGDMQFIPSDYVFDAMQRGPGRYLGDDPLILGIDLARGGGDDCFLQFRRGKDAKSEKVYRIPAEKSRDSMRVVSLITTVLERHKPDVTFLDEGGLGGPIVDRLSQLGYHVIGVNFGSDADDKKHYRNKVAEMWVRMRQWLQDGGSIPNDNDLEMELTTREYDHNDKDQLVLERKRDMKKSPDWADALSLTFAYHVPKRQTPRGMLDSSVGLRENMNNSDYNPLD
tara:strand:+ start:405 stop:1925 length:1521 start_codon:yes stop_codon:yes gene_type:complete